MAGDHGGKRTSKLEWVCSVHNHYSGLQFDTPSNKINVFAYHAVVWSIHVDRFHSIFHHGNWREKMSCGVDVNQSVGSMVM